MTAPSDPVARPSGAWPDKRWVVGLFMSLTIITGVGVITNRSFTLLTDASRRLEHSYQTLYQIERLTSVLKDATSQQRGYLLTGDPGFVESYDTDTKSVSDTVMAIRTLIGDDADQLRRLNALEPLIAQTMNLLGQTIQARESSSRAPVDPDSLRQTGTQMAEINSLAGQMTDAENRLFHDRDEAAKHQALVMGEIEIVGSLLSVLIIGVTFLLMSREIGRRRHTEETLQNLNAALEQRVTTRTT